MKRFQFRRLRPPLAAAFALATAAGCRTLPLQGLRNASAPSASAWLDGDILLTRSPAPEAALFAQNPRFPGPYSHAAVFYHDAAGNPRVLHIHGDLATTSLPEFLAGAAKLAVLRHDAVSRGHNPLTAAIRAYTGPRRKAVPSLFSWKRHASGPLYTCVTLVNLIYREAGLDQPFAGTSNRPDQVFLRFYRAGDPSALHALPCANSVLGNPRFQRIASWTNPSIAPERLLLADIAAERLMAAFRRGLRFRPPPWGTRFEIRLVTALKAQNSLSALAFAIRVQYRRYVQTVSRNIVYLRRRGRLPAPPEKRAQIIRELCDRVLPRYLTPAVPGGA